jgi:hypothetical protein
MKREGDAVSEIVFRITNSVKEDITLHLEPWGEEYIMSNGVAYKVEAKGPDNDTLELEYAERKLIVYGWPGSVVTINKIERPQEGFDQQDPEY